MSLLSEIHTCPDPPENYHLIVKILPKTWHFFQKIAENFHFFQKIAIGNFFEKNENFGQFFWKNVKFLAIFWQSNGNFPEGQPESVILSWKDDVLWHSTGDEHLPCLCIHRLSFVSTHWRLLTSCFCVALLFFCLELCLPLQLSNVVPPLYIAVVATFCLLSIKH